MGDDQRSNLARLGRNRAAQAPRSRGPHDSTGYEIISARVWLRFPC